MQKLFIKRLLRNLMKIKSATMQDQQIEESYNLQDKNAHL